MLSFKELNLNSSIIRALESKGYTNPTKIQEQAIPLVLSGKDLLGCAQTGTGKTAAFAIPVLQILESKAASGNNKKIKALILSPTRELAVQIGESFAHYGKYTNIKHTVIYGGVSQHAQTASLKKGVDVVIATPGRLKDLMQQGFVNLSHTELFILDEADRMLDMGFIHDIKSILSKLPTQRQSLFFTATLSPEIKKLAATILVSPEKVEVTPTSSAAETVDQSVYYVDKQKKKSLLMHLLKDEEIPGVLIFTRTKHRADSLSDDLIKSGIKTGAIHGGKSQQARQRALTDFKMKKIRVLVATDVAARGIDIQQLSHVINYEMPEDPETYVHRIGRTGRAGSSGQALSFCDRDERIFLKQINKLISKEVPVIENHPFVSTDKSEVLTETRGTKKKWKGAPKGSIAKRVNKRTRIFQKNDRRRIGS